MCERQVNSLLAAVCADSMLLLPSSGRLSVVCCSCVTHLCDEVGVHCHDLGQQLWVAKPVEGHSVCVWGGGQARAARKLVVGGEQQARGVGVWEGPGGVAGRVTLAVW